MQFLGHNRVHRPDGSQESHWLAITCAHCGVLAHSAVVAKASGAIPDGVSSEATSVQWVQCNGCGWGSVINSRGSNSKVSPPASFGVNIKGLPGELDSAYEEVRGCMSIGSFTAAEHMCRKILMHVSIDKGAKPNKSFADYVSHLEAKSYVTPPMKPWVDRIRKNGNTAAHELPKSDQKRAESTVMFTIQLLKVVYEMDYIAQGFAPQTEV